MLKKKKQSPPPLNKRDNSSLVNLFALLVTSVHWPCSFIFVAVRFLNIIIRNQDVNFSALDIIHIKKKQTKQKNKYQAFNLINPKYVSGCTGDFHTSPAPTFSTKCCRRTMTDSSHGQENE